MLLLLAENSSTKEISFDFFEYHGLYHTVTSAHKYVLLNTLRKEISVVTLTYQISTKHTQHRNKLIIHMITLM